MKRAPENHLDLTHLIEACYTVQPANHEVEHWKIWMNQRLMWIERLNHTAIDMPQRLSRILFWPYISSIDSESEEHFKVAWWIRKTSSEHIRKKRCTWCGEKGNGLRYPCDDVQLITPMNSKQLCQPAQNTTSGKCTVYLQLYLEDTLRFAWWYTWETCNNSQ